MEYNNEIIIFIPQVPSNSDTAATSATEKKFEYMQLLREAAIPGDDETEATEENANVHDTYSTVIVRASQLTELVKMLLCPTCQCATLAVRAVNCSLGAGMQVGDVLCYM